MYSVDRVCQFFYFSPLYKQILYVLAPVVSFVAPQNRGTWTKMYIKKFGIGTKLLLF